MKKYMTLLCLAGLALTGCAAIHSLIIHPLEKVHEIHENQEQEEREQATNQVVAP